MEPSAPETTDPAPADRAPDAPDAPEAAEPEGARASRPVRWWACLLIGAAAGVIGLVPWLVTGMRLPLQNLWATDAAPDEYPLVLLPFSQYALPSIAALLVVGAAVAGIAMRAVRPLRHRSGVAWALVGLLAVQVAAIVQTTLVVRDGLEDRPESAIYLIAVVAVAVLANLVGVLVMLLVAAAPRAGAVIGLSIAAVLVGPWLVSLLAGSGPLTAIDLAPVLSVLRWAPAVLVGAAIAWGGVATVGRVVAAITALVVLWIGPALITAVSSAAGSRVLARRPSDMLDYAIEVFRSAATMPDVVLPPLIAAVVIAVVGLVALVVVRRSRGGSRRTTDA